MQETIDILLKHRMNFHVNILDKKIKISDSYLSKDLLKELIEVKSIIDFKSELGSFILNFKIS